MNPQSPDRLPSLNLPKPQIEASPLNNEVALDAHTSETKSAQALERTSGMQAMPAPPQAITSPLTLPQAPVVPGQPLPPSPVMNTPAIADDTDLIEKEWVEKAKEIIAHTKSDPHLQNQEITKIKADYMKKRYNKDIKTQD
jgi:hypothetical protein